MAAHLEATVFKGGAGEKMVMQFDGRATMLLHVPMDTSSRSSITAVVHMRVACMRRTHDVSLIERSTFLLYKRLTTTI